MPDLVFTIIGNIGVTFVDTGMVKDYDPWLLI